jgi:hypothetical protein
VSFSVHFLSAGRLPKLRVRKFFVFVCRLQDITPF